MNTFKKLQKWGLGLSFVLISYALIAQNSLSALDSTLSIAENTNNHDTARALAYVEAFKLTRSYLNEESLQHAQKALNIATHATYIKGMALANSALGYYYRFAVVDFDISIMYYLKAKSYAKEAGLNNEYGTICAHLGIMNKSLGKLHTAYNYFLETSRVLEEEGNYQNSGLGYALLAELFTFKEDYVNAEKYFKKAIDRYTQNERFVLLEQAYYDYAYMLIKQKRINEAEQIRNERIEGIRKYTQPEFGFILTKLADQSFLAKLNHTKNQCLTAIQHLDSVELLSKEINYKLSMDFYLSKTACFIHIQDYKKAQSTLNLSYKTKSDLQDAYDRLLALELQANIFESTGNLSKAVKLYKQYNEMSDSLRHVANSLNLKDLEASLQATEREKENMELKMILEMQQQKARIQWILITSSIIAIILSILIISILINSRRKIRKKNMLLNEQNKEIQAQNEEITAQNEEIISQTEQLKIKNEYLEFQNEKLEEINQEKEGLMSIVAHDLRAPLNRTKGLACLLRTRVEFAKEDQTIIDKIIQVSDDGINLIRDILEINENHHIERTPNYTAINLKQFFHEEIIKQYQEQATRKMIELVTVIEDRIEILTDTSSIKRIFENLVSNAIKFSPPQTNVTIRATQSHDFIFIGIQDEGPGISLEDQQKMFRKFQRLSARPTAGEHSTGLGLSIVKSLVEKLKGEITVESDLDAGTEFIIKLPKKIMALNSMVSTMAS